MKKLKIPLIDAMKIRNKQIIEMRQDRYKLREIAEKYNITKERVRQITYKEN